MWLEKKTKKQEQAGRNGRDMEEKEGRETERKEAWSIVETI